MPIPFRYPDNAVRISDVYLKEISAKYKPGTFLSQFKTDGWRCPVYRDGGEFKFYAKRGRTTERDKPPPEYLVKALLEMDIPDGCAFDAEWMGPRDIKGILNGRHYLILFDLMYHDGKWIGDQRFDKRFETLKSLIKPTELIQVAETRPSGWFEMFEESKQDWLNEGIILREADSKLEGHPNSPHEGNATFKVKWRDIHEATKF